MEDVGVEGSTGYNFPLFLVYPVDMPDVYKKIRIFHIQLRD